MKGSDDAGDIAVAGSASDGSVTGSAGANAVGSSRKELSYCNLANSSSYPMRKAVACIRALYLGGVGGGPPPVARFFFFLHPPSALSSL